MSNQTLVGIRCPNCQHTGVELFYTVKNVPVHSCVLLDNPAKAAKFPTGNIELALCPSCGFIFNTAFDASRVDYTQPYEDQQVFSPTFREFSRGLAQSLIERYELKGKTILEIGCGKGDFLLDLCQNGRNRGIGIDPALRPERFPKEARTYIQCIRQYFGAEHISLRADFICCRHTLEHVPDTLNFMRSVRRLAGGSERIPVFFEVPDTMRVLKECAFWDIYYEHCSYFTHVSAANLFRLSGFEVVEIELAYGDQYLLIHAVPSEGQLPDHLTSFPREESRLIRTLVQEFSSSAYRKIEKWRKILHRYYRDGRRIAVWGSGSKAVSFLTTLGVRNEVSALVDINPYRHGKYIPVAAHEIVPPEELRKVKPDVVIVMNPIYREEIQRELSEMGLHPETIALQ